MATIVTIAGTSGIPTSIRIEELDDAKTMTDILYRNGYAVNLRGAN